MLWSGACWWQIRKIRNAVKYVVADIVKYLSLSILHRKLPSSRVSFKISDITDERFVTLPTCENLHCRKVAMVGDELARNEKTLLM